MTESVVVSGEMLAIIGRGETPQPGWPDDAVAFGFTLGATATLACRDADVRPDTVDTDLTLVVARGACRRIFAYVPDTADLYLSQELRVIAGAIRDCAHEGEPRATYCAAKAIELLCETLRLLKADALVPMIADALSRADSRRLIEARRLIDERWHEKLTLDRIARDCGLNRVKLTKGFREMFDCTVATAIAQRRLDAASRMLRTTDRPISSIGYDSGYLNNASFARAFSRHFGLTPSDYRAGRLAA